MRIVSRTPRRIVALWFPRLATDRLQRKANRKDSAAGLSEAAAPLVVAAKAKNMLRLSAVDRHATSLGLAIGQPLANARAMLPALHVVEADESADAQLLSRIADWCGRFSPLVALDGGRGVLLDVTGASHLFGGEQAMLSSMCKKLRDQGFAVRGAMAGTAVAARALAHHCDGSVVVPGGEAQAIAPLPISALNLDAASTHALRRAGLKTVGQAASRKRAELVARLGAGTMAIVDEALGHVVQPITPRKPPPDYWLEQNFAEPIASDGVIQAALATLTQALGKVLDRHGQGARRLEALFFRADGAVRCVAIELGTPTRDATAIGRLFREKLKALADPLDPGFGFDLIRLSAVRVERMDLGSADFNACGNEKAELGFLVDRLASRFGSQRILAFLPHETHVPEAAWVMVPAQHAEPAPLSWKRLRSPGDAPRRPLRLFVRPEAVDVTASHFLWRKLQHVVVRREGPERIAMEWWRHQTPQPARDYFRVEDGEGRRYWLCRKNAQSQWFLHGVFA